MIKTNINTWDNGFNFDSNDEDLTSTQSLEETCIDAHSALTRFYQKENTRSKTVKQKKYCWN